MDTDDLKPLLGVTRRKPNAMRNKVYDAMRKQAIKSKGYKRLRDNDSDVIGAGSPVGGDSMDNYYIRQAGSGIGGFSGVRYQKGDGFFGRFVSGAILPLIKKVLPFLGKTALNTGVNIVQDLSQGQKFRESAKKRLRETADQLGDKAIAKVKEMTGTGLRRSSKKRGSKKRKRRSHAKKVVVDFSTVPKSRKRRSTGTKRKRKGKVGFSSTVLTAKKRGRPKRRTRSKRQKKGRSKHQKSAAAIDFLT